MLERQAVRMQRLPWKLDRSQHVWSIDVSLLPDQRVTAQPGLETDLVALARDQPYFDQRRAFERLENAVTADRFLPRRVAGAGPLLYQSLLVPHEVIAPRAFGRLRMAVDNRQVDALRFPPPELILQRLLRSRRPRKHDQA
jgi:hypothetical protein